jgi:CCR4-NOT transcription complex subunit 9
MHQQTHHQHAQAQHAAVAAASQAAAAQQRHYNQIAANHNAPGPSISSVHGQDSSMMENVVSDENRRTLSFIADLLNEDSREAALLELSKKREQVPELALILWHSFGRFQESGGNSEGC